MKRFLFFVAFLSLLTTACDLVPPMSKDMYITQYQSFVEETKNNFRDYDEAAWETRDVKFKQYSRDYFDQYRDEMSEEERANVQLFKVEYMEYKLRSKGRRFLDGVEDKILDMTD